MRDKLKDKKYFEEFVNQTEKRVSNFSSKLNNNEVKEDRISNVEGKINSLKYELIEANYSRGEELKNITAFFYDYLTGFLKNWESSNYIGLLWNLSISIMLEIDDTEFNKLVQLVLKDNLNDYLIDFLVYSKDNTKDIKHANFEFDTPYKSLAEVISLAKNDKQESVNRLKIYLEKEWYKGHSDMGWYNSHKESMLLYSGYWCWEAGALVKILGLDDRILEDQQYYPYDMVHFK
ncbi:PoNe immunity protein domain-containing protein [Aquimarina algiphila]|uniref:PoNe immunity protein domain-containing protein n=1 Tax=Aquimarina algiphila TaxID=2047982 RepID=UPI00232D3471|nr:PoNe immunity protein domain-containing protein [Aquimarina algiphila]